MSHPKVADRSNRIHWQVGASPGVGVSLWKLRIEAFNCIEVYMEIFSNITLILKGVFSYVLRSITVSFCSLLISLICCFLSLSNYACVVEILFSCCV